MTQRVVVVVQARMGSTRLPGKVLLPVAGKPMFSYQIERLRRCRQVHALVTATTTEPADDALVAFCRAENVDCIRGSEHDVLSRYALAARALDGDVVVRVTSDCPLIDPELVDDAIVRFNVGDVDYVSNMMRPTWPYGMAVEVMSRDALDTADREARSPAEREHVTPFIYWHPERFRLASMTLANDLSGHRWTVDTIEDFELVSRLLVHLWPKTPEFRMKDVLDLLAEHPDWVHINQHVLQKTIASANQEKK